MKRIHLFEFEDFKWFPNWLRDCLTRYLVSFHKILDTKSVLAKILDEALQKTNSNSIIDLCSGSGGPLISTKKVLENQYKHQNLTITFSDLYPHKKFANTINSGNDKSLSYITNPVNASNVDRSLKGIRTMICSLHHMKPEIAKAILKNAQDNNEAICVFEISDNGFPKWLWWTAFPITFISVFFITPVVRPLTWQQLVFTYLIPVLPFFIAWDGAVSNARTYTLNDLDILLKDLQSPNYTWKKETVKGKGGNKLFLLGLPN